MFKMQTESLIALLISLAAAVIDGKTKRISCCFLAAAGLTGAVLWLSNGRDILSVMTAMIPGAFLFGLSFLSRGAVGTGDAWFVLILALFFSAGGVCFILLLAFFQAALCSLVILAAGSCRRESVRNKTLPFLCFFPLGVLLWSVDICRLY